MLKVFALLVLSSLPLAHAGAAAPELAVNGSFEEGTPGATVILPGWQRRTAGNSFHFHSIVADDAAAGSRCARIAIPEDAVKGSGYLMSHEAFPLQGGKTYRISLRARNPKGKAQVYLIPYDSAGRAMPFAFYGKFAIANAPGWRAYEFVYRAPDRDPKGCSGRLQLALNGPGEVRYDQVGITEISAADAAQPAAPSAAKPAGHGEAKQGNLIANGSFEEGKVGASTILPGWVRRTAGNSFRFHSIVTDGAAHGKRCARIAIPKDAPPRSTGYVSAQWLKLAPGKCYELTFQARCPEGRASAQLILYDGQKRYLGAGRLRRVPVENGGEWRTYRCEYFTPERGADGFLLNLQLQLEGPGEVYFDDVRLTEAVPEAVKTEFYPSSLNYGKPLVGLAGEPTPLIFYFFTAGPRSSFTLELEVPENFRPVFSGVVYAAHSPAVPAEARPGAPAGRQRYRLTLPADAVQPMTRYAGDLFFGLALLFEGDPGTDALLRWQLFQAEKKVDGGSFQLEMLPAPTGRLPKTPVIFSWYEPFLNYIREEPLLERYLAKLKRSGITGGSISESSAQALFNAADFTNQRGFWLQPPDHCLTALLENPETERRIEAMAQRLSGYRNAVLCWNYEPGLAEYYHFCSRCQAAFRTFAGLPAEAVPGDGRAAEARYPEQYLKFRNDQQRKIVARFAELCRRHKVRSGINGYRVSRDTDMRELERQTGGVRQLIELVDVYQAQIYALPELLWPRQHDMLAFHPDTAITYTTDERSNGGTFSYSLLTPELIESEILIAGLQRVKQLVLFVGAFTMDGRQTAALRRALDRLAAREFLLEGEARDLPSAGAQNVHWREFRRDGRTLLAAVNCDSARTHWSAVPLAARQIAVDPERKTRHRPDGEGRLAVKLAPGEVRFFELTAPERAMGLTEEAPAMPEPPRQPRTLFRQNGWSLEEDSAGVIAVRGPGAPLRQIDRRGGAVLFDAAACPGASGGWFRDLFRQPREAAWSSDCRDEYEFLEAKTLPGGVEAVFRRDLTHRELRGLTLLKCYRLTPHEVTVTVTVRNTGKSPKKIAFWQHHRPDFKKLPLHFAAGGKTLTVDDRSPVNNYLDGTNAPQLTADGRFCLTLSRAPEKYYFWKGATGSVSCEMFFPEATLAPGAEWQIVTALREAVPGAALQ